MGIPFRGGYWSVFHTNLIVGTDMRGTRRVLAESAPTKAVIDGPGPWAFLVGDGAEEVVENLFLYPAGGFLFFVFAQN